MKKILIVLVFTVLTQLLSPHAVQADALCPGFTCPVNQQCGKNIDGSYFCAACPIGADGLPRCRAATSGTTDGETAVGSVVPPAPVSTSPNAVFDYVPTVLQGIYFFALILVLGYLIFGGVKYITSGGDSKAIMAARNTMFQAIVGIILLAISLPVARLMQGFLGSTAGSRIAAPGTSVTIYTCGNGRSPISEQRVFCQSPGNTFTAEQWNGLDQSIRDRACISPGECDAGCIQNDRDRQAGVARGDPPNTDYFTRCRPL